MGVCAVFSKFAGKQRPPPPRALCLRKQGRFAQDEGNNYRRSFEMDFCGASGGVNNLDFLFCRHRRIPPGDRFFDRIYILFLSLLLSRQRPKKRLIRPRINIPHRHKRGSLFAQMRRGTLLCALREKKLLCPTKLL